MIPQVEINYVAVLVATIVSFVIGFLWYGPVFGKQWMALMGITKKDMEAAKKKGMAKSMGKSAAVMLVCLFVLEFVFAHAVKTTATTLADGLFMGFFVWLGFIATVMLGSVLWEKKPVKLYAINAAHYLVVLLVSGAILVSMA